jgi:hypothetical protein
MLEVYCDPKSAHYSPSSVLLPVFVLMAYSLVVDDGCLLVRSLPPPACVTLLLHTLNFFNLVTFLA